MTKTQLFPDIRLLFGAESAQAAEDETEISICIGGGCEYKASGEYFYLTAGSCIIRGSALMSCRTVYSPDYHGISLLMNTHCVSYYDVFDMRKRFTDISENEMRIFRADDNIRRLAEELYAVRGSSRTSMLRIKAVELLMLLGEVRYRHCEHTDTIRQVGEFICQNIFEHNTIPQLAELFAMTPHTLKAEFDRYFGSSVYAYTKLRKMFRAAELIRSTDMKIIDIAEEVGYCNASKFSSAFRSVIGITPKDYRTEHKSKESSENRVSQAD